MSTSTHANPYLAESSDYRPDRFYRHADMGVLLTRWAEAHPTLASLGTIGRSHEDRDIWCMTLTNAATGTHDAKPAYFIDANIHAGEVTGSAVALYTIRQLLVGHGNDPRCTRLLDQFTFYIVPRVSPDGAEVYLTEATSLRSSVRAYPEPKEAEGLRQTDVNDDGWIATMRIPDPGGPWKVSERDPRLMVPRAPDEDGGQYYWVVPEGMLSNYDPAEDGLLGEVKPAAKLWGLDLNRNFPNDWEPEGQTPGAGPYPLSEPETRALVDFFLAHPNIAGSQHYHTFSGVILRPSSRRADIDLPKADLAAYKALGKIGEEETGYACISIYENFTTDKRKLYAGMLLDWAYDHLGLVTFSTELWSLGLHLGLKAEQPLDFYFRDTRTEDDDMAMLAWVDETLEGFGYLPWTPFDHPQLGPVEIGGWQIKYVFQNAPGPLLEEISRRNANFTLRAAGASPRVVIRETQVTPLGAGLYRVEAVAENVGFLPTSVTERAIAAKAVRPDKFMLTLPAGATLEAGELEQALGYLPGRSEQYEPHKLFLSYGVPNRRKARWIVKAPEGGTVGLELVSQRGGRVSVSLDL